MGHGLGTPRTFEAVPSSRPDNGLADDRTTQIPPPRRSPDYAGDLSASGQRREVRDVAVQRGSVD
jgi:hypothetical protein